MTKIVLKNVRCSFPHLFEPTSYNGQEGKYSMQIIMDENHPQRKQLDAAVLDAAREKFPTKVKSNIFPASLKSPIRDGAEKSDERPEYLGKIFFNASSKNKPLLCDKHKNKLTEDDGLFYPGCFVNVSLNTYGFDAAGNKGVAIGLNGVQFRKDGEALGGTGKTIDDFDVIEDEEEEEVDIPFDKGGSIGEELI